MISLSFCAQVEGAVTVKVLWSPHKWRFLKMWVNHSKSDALYTWNVCLPPSAVIVSWRDPSSVKAVRGSSRFVMSPEPQSKSTSPCRVLRTASSPSPEPKTRSRTLSICYRTGVWRIQRLQQFTAQLELWNIPGVQYKVDTTLSKI